MSGALNEKNQFPSFTASSGSKSIPGISGWSSITFQFHVSACVCSVHLPHSLSQETGASAKVYLVLEKWAPWREHCHSRWYHCLQPRKLHWCWLWTQGRIITGPQASWTASETCFLPWGLWVPLCQNKEEGEADYCPPSLPHTWLSGCWENLFHSDYLISCCVQRPFRGGELGVLCTQVLLSGFSNPDRDCICYSVLFNFAWLRPFLNNL